MVAAKLQFHSASPLSISTSFGPRNDPRCPEPLETLYKRVSIELILGMNAQKLLNTTGKSRCKNNHSTMETTNNFFVTAEEYAWRSMSICMQELFSRGLRMEDFHDTRKTSR